MQKNSYVVLTKDLVKGNELLDTMYERMMDPNDPIDIINTESAKKLFKGQLFEVNQELGEQMFDGLESRDMDGSKLYMPQIINDKEDMTAKMNRQIRKGIPAMVDKTATYTLADGTLLPVSSYSTSITMPMKISYKCRAKSYLMRLGGQL